MSKPYWSGPGTLRGSDGRGYRADPGQRGYDGYSTGLHDPHGEYHLDEDTENYDAENYDTEDYDAENYDAENYDAYGDYYEQHDTRWRWVAVCAAVVLLIAVAATAVLMYGTDSSTSSLNRTQEGWQELTPSTTPRTVIATVPPTESSTAPLPPETVVTVTTAPSAAAEPTTEAPQEAAPDTRTVTYTVTGSRQLIDLVSIIYTDEQGFPRTDVNVALPWTKTVVLNPGVEVQSVTATSLLGHLNCAITDSTGAPIVVQTNNTMIATCTK